MKTGTGNEIPQYTIMQVPFHGLTPQSALEVLLGFLQTEHNHLVVTPNPEGVMLARRNGDFLRILQNANLVLADAIGILLAARWLKLPIPCRVTGCDTTLALLDAAKGHTCYLLGSAPGIADTAMANLKKQGVHVIGARDGYFDDNVEKDILEEIRMLKPDILIVGMGMLRQEAWAAKYLHTLPCKVTMCVGGTIDIIAGNVKRAPKIMQRIGMEWLWRLMTNPSRFRRMLDLPRFAWAVLSE
ncbi:MAG: WecB/TagA/CpsF family glycosyltransferase [Defluviitaleaceae bacterium]|nr:WecB/TagA/CpsF family glycosyltransferase [Defluviitaleaceae bacterium]